MTDEVQLPPGDVAPASTEPAPAPAEDPNVAASVAEPSSTAETVSAPTVSADAGASQPAASSPAEAGKVPASVAVASSPVAEAAPSQTAPAAEPQTFEQRVELRFLALEQHLMNLPHSIMYVMQQGSMEAEEFAGRVLVHLFSKDK